jgi:excisionase family DNA binding protein
MVLTLREAADALQVSEKTLRTMILQGRLQAVRTGPTAGECGGCLCRA